MSTQFEMIPGVDPLESGYYIWQYRPNMGAAIFFLVLFLLTTGWGTYRTIKTRAWFAIVFLIGGLLEIIGYGGRAAAHSSTGTLGPYIVQSIMLLVAPALFAASVYMTLGRIIRLVEGEKYSLISPGKLTKIFVAGDVFSFFVQSGGAGIMASGNADKTKMGEKIIIGGLIVQVIMFGLFAVVAAMFHHRIAQFPTTASRTSEVPWRRCLSVLYIISALIMIRSIFRVVEYAGGHDGYLLRNEWTLYVFDSALMFIVTAIFDIRNFHEGRLPSDTIDMA